MNIDINTPEIVLLRKAVELHSGITPRLASDFIQLAEAINSRSPERLSQSTLERLWQYSTRRKPTVAQHTLDVLSRYVGFDHWVAFCDDIRHHSHPESDYFADGILDVDSIPVGRYVKLSWLPDRKITVRYLGGRRFEVIKSLNSSIGIGDTFECTQMQVGQPLYMDHFLRKGQDCSGTNARYVVGRDSGLISIEIEDRT